MCNNASEIKNSPRFLWFLILTYSMVIVMSNCFDARLIDLFGDVLPPGILIFPFTFLISDMITEVYGYRHARRAIWAAFLFSFLLIAYGQLLTHLPSPSFAKNNNAFDRMLSVDVWVVIASLASYLSSEPLNSYIVAKMKIRFEGRWMSLRFVLSTVTAAVVDSTVFAWIAFGRLYPSHAIWHIALNMWVVKVIVEVVGLPVSLRLAKWLKQKEGLDIYDVSTRFSPLSLRVGYSRQDNRF